MFSVLVIRLRSLRLLRVSGIVMRLRMFLLLITFLKASHSFRNCLLVICMNAYLFATMIMTSVFFPSRRRHTILVSDWSSDVCSSDLESSGADVLDDPALDLARVELHLTGGVERGAHCVEAIGDGEPRLDPVTLRSPLRRLGRPVKSKVFEYVQHDLGFVATAERDARRQRTGRFHCLSELLDLPHGAACGKKPERRCAVRQMRGTHRRFVICQIEAVDDIGLEAGGELERAGKMPRHPLDQH